MLLRRIGIFLTFRGTISLKVINQDLRVIPQWAKIDCLAAHLKQKQIIEMLE